MRSRRTDRLEKVVFGLSVLVLVFLSGYASRTFGWFPDSFLQQAWLEARLAAIHSGGIASPVPISMVPRVHDGQGAEVLDRAAMQPGLTLLASMWKTDGGWEPGLRLIDADGEVLHAWRVDVGTFLGASDSVRRSVKDARSRSVHGTYLFRNGDVLANIDYVGTVRLDACSRPRWRLVAGSNHSIARADDGTFWIPGSTDLRPSNHPLPIGPIYRDLMLRVSGKGEVLDRIDVLDLLYANDLQDHLLKAQHTDQGDATHLNDIEPLPDSIAGGYSLFSPGDLLVSLRNLNLIMVVDPATRRVKWHTSDPFLAQHDPDFIGRGWIGVLDNRWDGTMRGTRLSGSRIVAVQPRTGALRTLYPEPGSDPFYTDEMGKWQQLANDDLLLTESRAGRVLEVTAGGRKVWQWLAPPYDAEHVPEVSEGTRYDLTPEAVAAWPCSPGHSSVPDSR
jgi:hypothetical protein